ncbi:MAG TPA: phenylalanine--tRNA ligase subunit beta [Gemmatimonadales bacterium]|nr:phenylalanine--tRNA ligase subunit beta [Gemmatimonadales bacterium]
MNVSRRWLEGFLRRPLDARDVATRLAMAGAPVDAIEPLAPGLEGVIVGLVEEVRPHPNADRLRLCLVNDGSAERRHVVCGAPNVTAGRKYPFAPIGVTVPHGKGGGPMTIERARIRGEVSEGMLCSARELGLGEDQSGLLELDTEAAPGTRLLDAVPVGDDRLVVDVTPNRPDLLGHKGIARELAASYRIPFRLPAIPGSPGATSPTARRVDGTTATIAGLRFGIEDRDGCARFLGARLRGVRVGPSPAWLARRLAAVGVRSINNVVDATNYVMHELNQPMHAYDASRLRGPSVIARRARPGEAVVTLDGVSRTLTDEMTVIADEAGAVGVAGVMGAAHVEVTEATTDVFLECAWFEPRRIRRTRRALGVSTEASYRFERGVDLWGGPDALRRCIELIQATAGGELVEEPLDVWPQVTYPPRIFLRPARVTQVLGVELELRELERCLTAIGATVVSKPADQRIAVDVPGWRPDITAEIDLVEEIARQHGYDNFPTELRPFRVGLRVDAPLETAAARVREALAARGLFEVHTLPVGPSEGPESVQLLNPLSAEEAYLRQRLIPGLLRQVELNWSRQTRDVRLFQIGSVFRTGGGPRPVEETHVAAVVTGARDPAHWTDPARIPAPELRDVDHWDLRALFEACVALALPGASVQVDGAAWVARTPEGRIAGRAERLDAEAPPWAAPVYGFELILDPAPREAPRFRALPATPAAERDLALILPAGVAAAQVEAVLRRAGGALLERVEIFDEYRGPSLPAGTRSVGFRLVLRAPDRTLRDAEVDGLVGRVVAALERELGIALRAS